MKKILLASTALIVSAAAADAQAVRIGGQGRMGIIYTNIEGYGSETVQENRLQLNFSVAVEGDNGLSFGAYTRARTQSALQSFDYAPGVTAPSPTSLYAAHNAASFSGSRVWVEAAGLRLTFGNIDGAFRGAGASHGYAGGCGIGYHGGLLCGDAALTGSQGFASTNQGPAARARLDYSFGDIAVALSADRNGSTEFGVRGSFDAFTVAFGYIDNTSFNVGSFAGWTADPAVVDNRVAAGTVTGVNVASLSAHYDGGIWGVGAIVARYSVPGVSETNGNVSASVELGGGTLYGYVGRNWGESAYGLSYSYGLGGGASIVAGAERGFDVGAAAEVTEASVGVVFNF